MQGVTPLPTHLPTQKEGALESCFAKKVEEGLLLERRREIKVQGQRLIIRLAVSAS